MKKNKATILAAVAAAAAIAACAWGQSLALNDRFRQTVQGAFDEVRAGLAASPIPAGKPVGVLPIAGDTDGWLGGLLKNALTAAGKTCLDPQQEANLKAAASGLPGWDARQEDILDEATLDRLESASPAGVLMTAVVRSLDHTERYSFFEVELHAADVETKRHIWGGVFARRNYASGVEGVGRAEEIPAEFRQILQERLRAGLANSLEGSAPLGRVGTVALLPLATDVHGYVANLVRDAMAERTHLRPVNLGTATLAEARIALRDRPAPADALLHGTLRELSKCSSQTAAATAETVYRAEVQLAIESPDGTVLWSDTLTADAKSTGWAPGTDPGVQERYREAVERAFEAAGEGLRNAPIPAEAPVAILPIAGDEDGWMAGLLKIALFSAGKNCVEAKDDPMWDEIEKEIHWPHLVGLDILDSETVAHFGKLQQGMYLLKATVRRTASRNGRPHAQVTLHATEIATKRHVWGGVFRDDKRGAVFPPPVTVAQALLNIRVEVRPVSGMEWVADELEAYSEGRLVDLGYRVGTGKDDDLVLTLEVEGSLYDRTGEWETYKGELKARLEVKGADQRLLGRMNFPSRGKPGIVPNGGERNLAYDMEEQLSPWLKRTLDPEAIPFSAIRLELALADSLETSADFAALENIRKAVAGMDGVKSVRLAGQDNAAGTVAYKVVYETEAYPGGFVNALFAAHPELLDKYLE